MSIISLGCGFVKNLLDNLSLVTAINMLANHNNGCKTAGAHTKQAVERELAVDSMFRMRLISSSRRQGTPMTNYGITIAHIKGILNKVALP